MPKKKILIVSSSQDTTAPFVEKSLTERGYRVVWYRTDLVAKGYVSANLYIDPTVDAQFVYNGENIDLCSIGAAWQRKPTVEIQFADKARGLSLTKEVRALQDGIWDILPTSIWVNHPTDIRNGELKIPQLLLAKQIGFSVPQTILSNRWDVIKNRLSGDDVILKMARGLLYEDKSVKVLYTTPLSKQNLPEDSNPFPGIWQPFVKKKREWRVTVVGEKIFSVAVYSDDDAKDDWRKYDGTGHVTFKQEPFPLELERKCLLMLKKMNLRYGAFDFIEELDGKITFLEVNPSGQYLWLERLLGLPISEAVADLLIAIADKKNTSP
jgi:hypothetical protein